MQALDVIIEQLERQKEAIERALEALQAVGLTKTPATHAAVNPVPTSQETGNARSIAQKARWAAVREGAAPQKRGLSVAGRKRLSENMRKRWAAKRTAAQAKKRKKAA